MDKEAVNGVATDPEPVQLSFPMPNAPATNIYLHLTVNATSVVLFLSSLAADSGAAAVAMGSFVYAMPNVSSCYYVFVNGVILKRLLVTKSS